MEKHSDSFGFCVSWGPQICAQLPCELGSNMCPTTLGGTNVARLPLRTPDLQGQRWSLIIPLFNKFPGDASDTLWSTVHILWTIMLELMTGHPSAGPEARSRMIYLLCTFQSLSCTTASWKDKQSLKRGAPCRRERSQCLLCFLVMYRLWLVGDMKDKNLYHWIH
jgi:hypothetical protein